MYEQQLCTVYRAENGFVVECREPAKSAPKKGEMAAQPETKTYTAPTAAAALKIVKKQLTGDGDEYAEAFQEAAAGEK